MSASLSYALKFITSFPLYFPEHLLNKRHPVLFSYLRQRRSYLERLGASLEAAATHRAGGRWEEVREEMTRLEEALAYYG